MTNGPDEMGLDGLQSGYLPNHKMDPAIVNSTDFGKYIREGLHLIRLTRESTVVDDLDRWIHAGVRGCRTGEFHSPDWNLSSHSPKFLAKPLVYTPTTRSQVVIAVSETNWVYLLDAGTGAVVKKRQVRRKLLYMCFFSDLSRLIRIFNC